MPLVRIDLPESIDTNTARKAGETVHKAMTEVINVPRATSSRSSRDIHLTRVI